MSNWKQLHNSKYTSWLMAKNRIERKYFWIRFIMFSTIIIVLAHFPYIGFTGERIMIPEASAWNLNPILWFPYYLAGQTYVRGNMSKGFWNLLFPPFQYMYLYILSLIYWLFIAFLVSKFLTTNKFKTSPFMTKSQRNKGDLRERAN
jgi:hypothetical protein